MLLLKNNIDYWKKEVRLSRYISVIYLNYRDKRRRKMSYLLVHGTDEESAKKILEKGMFLINEERAWGGTQQQGYVYWHLIEVNKLDRGIYDSIEHALAASASKRKQSRGCSLFFLTIPEEIACQLPVLFDDGIHSKCLEGMLSEASELQHNDVKIDVLFTPQNLNTLIHSINCLYTCNFDIYSPEHRYLYIDFKNSELLDKLRPVFESKEEEKELHMQSEKVHSGFYEFELLRLEELKKQAIMQVKRMIIEQGWNESLSV